MKQVISVLVEVELDYGNPEIKVALEETMAELGKTIEEIRAEAHDEIVKGVKELIDNDFSSPLPGITHSVEDITVCV